MPREFALHPSLRSGNCLEMVGELFPEAQELDAQPHPDDESEVGPDDTQGGPVALEGVGEDGQRIRLPFKMRE